MALTAQDPLSVVREFYAGLNEQNLDRMMAVVSDQVEFVDYSLAEALRGKDKLRQYFQNWITGFPKGKGQIGNTIATGEHAIVEVLAEGKHDGPFVTRQGTSEPTGNRIPLRFCQIFRVKDGLIVGGHSYWDPVPLILGLGLGKTLGKAA